MITPFFKLRQDDLFLIVEIRAPNANIKDTEIEFFDRTFYFSSVPYFLRLALPGDVEGGTTDAKTDYNVETGTFTIQMPKRNKGEQFPRLDMLSELLKPQRPSGQKAVEELDESGEHDDEVPEDEVQVKQELPVDEKTENKDDEQIREYGYGFAWLRHGILSKFGTELEELFDLHDADSVKIDERLLKIQKIDEQNFDSEYYLAELFDESDELTEIKKLEMNASDFELNDEDRLQMKDLRIVKLPQFTTDEQRQISYSLADLLFAYLFDLRINQWETNALTEVMIGKLAPSLSGCVRYSSAKEAICTAIRRSLCYSLYRQFDLGLQVANDLSVLLSKGRSKILHCLLTIRKSFNNSGQEFVYLYNQLYLDNYCIWIQSVDDSILDQLISDVKEASKDLKRSDIAGLDLDYLESEARMLKLKVDTGEYDSDDG
ncbi:Protein SHQ1-like protein [Aphelenchoides bicaudatus]|nr:Protein SHQ1-like protein [Aphelenchoides bicaudatus]